MSSREAFRENTLPLLASSLPERTGVGFSRLLRFFFPGRAVAETVVGITSAAEPKKQAAGTPDFGRTGCFWGYSRESNSSGSPG